LGGLFFFNMRWFFFCVGGGGGARNPRPAGEVFSVEGWTSRVT
jgi:hypothetical protein